jgi:hypothetical protein
MTTRPLLTDRTKARLRAVVERLPQVDVALRRGNTTLAAQQFYLAPIPSKATAQNRSDGGERQRGDMAMYGAIDADVQRGDRWTYQGTLFRVMFISPDRSVFTQVELEAVQ